MYTMLNHEEICMHGSKLNGFILPLTIATYVLHYLHVSVIYISDMSVKNVSDIETLLFYIQSL